ncbi:hypothetical protein FOXG_18617 [Fusarium oxysporum f. sp. lycopersici 4287]|uniref:Uncharacterized protein n=2 Tax=Fusarium oxysporum TaxID=5507 RepID=A0A0J9UM00_FUSO4|nr:hypothetical protein FOXG_18617 [Fusarium oxysporum f. sp. lycopersici 4287]EXK31467.1 hypothetical protein FOMG_13134 [Fusarium oxysporum f. sp. melonis 26406]KNA99927.1 hypothetical protein FOXG_18617 [Fusarium oxysporum f. sp. lycopersici 4287]
MSWSATFFFDIALSVEWGWETSCLRREALYHVNQQILSKASWLFQRTLLLMQVSIGQTPLIPGKLLLFCRVSIYTCFSPWFPGTNNKRRLIGSAPSTRRSPSDTQYIPPAATACHGSTENGPGHRVHESTLR